MKNKAKRGKKAKKQPETLQGVKESALQRFAPGDFVVPASRMAEGWCTAVLTVYPSQDLYSVRVPGGLVARFSGSELLAVTSEMGLVPIRVLGQVATEVATTEASPSRDEVDTYHDTAAALDAANIALDPDAPAAQWGGGKVGCAHWRDPFKIADDLTVYLSGWRHNGRHDEDAPDAGVYMTPEWIRDQALLTNSWMHATVRKGPEVLYIQWPDMGVIGLRPLDAAVTWILERVRRGRRVELACFGGHGRTGSMLGAVLLREGASVKEAIERVRGPEYCGRAIESKAQEAMLARYAKALEKRGKDD